MKRFLCLFVVLGILGYCLSAAAKSPSKFSLRLEGGWSSLDGSDLNTGVQGHFESVKNLLNFLGYTAQGDFLRAEAGRSFDFEILAMITGRLGVGVGAGMFSASERSVIDLSLYSTHLADFTYNIKARAVPVHLSLYYYLPLSRSLNLFAEAGVAYYLAEADWEFTVAGSWPQSHTAYNADGGGLGMQGGIGLDWAPLKHFGVYFKAAGRRVSCSGFEGTASNSTTTEGRLFYVETATLWGHFPILLLAETTPASPDYVSVREAKVDFSGFSLLAGVFVRF